jgi:hypothetical protein
MIMQEKTKNAVKELIGSSAVAAILEIDKTTVLRVATRCNAGVEVAGRMLFSTQDIEAIRKNCHGGPGNPNFKKSS